MRESVAPLEEALRWARGERAQLQLLLRQVLARLGDVERELGEMNTDDVRCALATLRDQVDMAQQAAADATEEAQRMRRQALCMLSKPMGEGPWEDPLCATPMRMTPMYSNPLAEEGREDEDSPCASPPWCRRAMDVLMKMGE